MSISANNQLTQRRSVTIKSRNGYAFLFDMHSGEAFSGVALMGFLGIQHIKLALNTYMGTVRFRMGVNEQGGGRVSVLSGSEGVFSPKRPKGHLQYPHCYMTTGRHGILVRGWVPDLCVQGLLDHVRLNTGPPRDGGWITYSVSYV